MAKYVGKIFKVKNSSLKIRGNDIHHVFVKWFNPFTRKFKCRVITSMEEYVPNNNKEILKNSCSVFDVDKQAHFILKKNKYIQLRNGYIESIPIKNCENFFGWGAFSKTVYLTRKELKKESKMKIKK